MTKQALSYHVLHGSLRPAVTADGTLNLDAPEMVAFLAARELTPDDVVARDAGAAPKKRGRPARATTPGSLSVVRAPSEPTESTEPEPEPSRPFRSPIDIDDLGEMTFNEIVRLHGSREGFGQWIALRQRVAATRKLEIANAQNEGKLIHREFVRIHVLSHIEAANRRLLSDVPSTIARRLIAMVKAGENAEVIKVAARDIIGANLAYVKTQAVRALREPQMERKDDVA